MIRFIIGLLCCFGIVEALQTTAEHRSRSVSAVRTAARTQAQSRAETWAAAAELWRPWRIISNGMLPLSLMNGSMPLREKYINDKLAVDKAVLNSLPLPKPSTSQSAGAGGKRKIAFLFMLMDHLANLDVWSKFFAGVPADSYSIYVHRAAGDSVASKKIPLSFFGAVNVPTVNSSWCALIGVEIALLNVALREPQNEQFVFLSHDSAPLKGFGYIYRNLIGKSPETSKFCFARPARHQHALVEQVSNEVNRRCVFRDYYSAHDSRVLKHHEWIVLSRAHAYTVARKARFGIDYWAKAWRKAAPDLHTMAEGCSDESVPITTLLRDVVQNDASIGDPWQDLEKIGVERKCLTYVNWYNCFTRSDLQLQGWGFLKSLRYRGEDLYRYVFDPTFDFVKDTKMNAFPMHFVQSELPYLKSLTSQGFMFGRKFTANATVKINATSTVNLVDILPQLWNEVDEDVAQSATWEHLSGPE